MKKITIAVLCLTMLFFVNCKALDFTKKTTKNYTSTGEFSLHVKNVDELYELIYNIESDQYVGFWNYNTFFKSMLTSDGTVNIKSDVSDDYKNIKLYMDAGYKYDVKANSLVSARIDVNAALWLDVNMSDVQNPKFDIIVASPFSDEYYYIDLLKILDKDDTKKLALLLAATNSIDKEALENMNSFSAEYLEKYAVPSEENGIYTIKLNNDELFEYIDAVLNYSYNMFASKMSFGRDKEVKNAFSLKDLELKILGEDGITVVYGTKDGKPEYSSFLCDVNFELREIFELFGKKYPLDKNFCVDAEFSIKSDYTEIGSTKVEIPEITEDNSISIADRIYPPMPVIPRYYVNIEYDDVLNVEEYYVPFDELMEKAFEDNVEFTVSDGIVRAESEYFKGFKTLKFVVGEETANIDGVEKEMGKSWIFGEKVFVGKEFVENILGWQISEYKHNLITNKNRVEIITELNDKEEDEANCCLPRYYASFDFSYMPNDGKELYVPLRKALDSAYRRKRVTLEFKNGVVTAKNKYFPNFETLSMKIGDSFVLVDGNSVEVGEIFLNDGVTYVPAKLFTDVFGWTLESVQHEIIDGVYSFEFVTQTPENEKSYVENYIYVTVDYVPEPEEDVIYLPFGEILRYAYKGKIAVNENDGVVTISGKNSPVITLDTVNNTVIFEGTQYQTGKIKVENGEVYVQSEVFTDVLDWTFDYATYDVMNEFYEFCLYTYKREK